MTAASAPLHDDRAGSLAMPVWIAAARGETPEDAAFLAGAALAHLDRAAAAPELPRGLWRERLALGAAVACARLEGRPEPASALRDAVHLLRPGDRPGPAGEIFAQWRRAVARPVSAAGLAGVVPAPLARCLGPGHGAGHGAGRGNPVARAAAVLEAALAEAPRAETAALVLADAALARAMGWDRLLPVLATGLTPREMRATGAALRLACDRAVLAAAAPAAGIAADLMRRAARLRAVAPKLRARRAGEAVALFLARDALAPAGLTGLMSDRAARRLCDRLTALGALRELTGRDSFRLYGV